MSGKFSTISVIGLGYIGLPTAAVIASRGVDVIGVDVNPQVVDIINSGKIHITEPDLDIIVHAVVQTGKLKADTKPHAADAFLIAVPTPFKDGHTPDLRFVEAAARAIAPVLKRGDLVILESTSPVGTTERMVEWLAQARPDLKLPKAGETAMDIHVAYCPERVLPGKVIHELMANDRVIGGITPHCAERARTLYKLFVQGECILTDARTAEMCKLSENSFRDVNIAFANELSLVCDKLGIDVWELIRLANRHPRVNILKPGPGVGGHCIAVDPWFIVDSAPEQARIIRTAREVNDGKPDWVIGKVMAMVAASGKKVTNVACLGLAFKADIDDLRESPALEITQKLAAHAGIKVLANEPNISVLPKSCAALPITLLPLEDALAQADIVLILVDHAPYKTIDWKTLKQPILDTKGIMHS